MPYLDIHLASGELIDICGEIHYDIRLRDPHDIDSLPAFDIVMHESSTITSATLTFETSDQSYALESDEHLMTLYAFDISVVFEKFPEYDGFVLNVLDFFEVRDFCAEITFLNPPPDLSKRTEDFEIIDVPNTLDQTGFTNSAGESKDNPWILSLQKMRGTGTSEFLLQ